MQMLVGPPQAPNVGQLFALVAYVRRPLWNLSHSEQRDAAKRLFNRSLSPFAEDDIVAEVFEPSHHVEWIGESNGVHPLAPSVTELRKGSLPGIPLGVGLSKFIPDELKEAYVRVSFRQAVRARAQGLPGTDLAALRWAAIRIGAKRDEFKNMIGNLQPIFERQSDEVRAQVMRLEEMMLTPSGRGSLRRLINHIIDAKSTFRSSSHA